MNMKTVRNLLLAILAVGLAAGPGRGQEAVGVISNPRASLTAPKDAEPEEPFDLDFKGGPPRHLVETVEKAAKRPVNVIIPEEQEGFILPPLKLRNVTVPQMFNALTLAGTKTEKHPNPQGGDIRYISNYGFKAADQRPNANSIWYFSVTTTFPPARISEAQCRFWQLEPYLERLKVEDITTAIETGWKMLGVTPLPKLSFHKDTKLLIVVGQHGQLVVVDDVLRELTPAKEDRKDKPRPAAAPPSARQ